MKRPLLTAFALTLACAPAAPPPPAAPAPPTIAIAPPPAPTETPPPPRADESFRAEAPAAGPATAFTPPVAKPFRLKNGIPVLIVHQPTRWATVHILAKGGYADVGADERERVGVFAQALWAGGAHHTLEQMNDEAIGLMMPAPSALAYADFVSVSFRSSSKELTKAIDLVADMTLHPTFDEKNFARWRDFEADSYAATVDDGATALRAVRHALFGEHFYAGESMSAKATRAVTRAQLVALHPRLFDASRLAVVVVGEVDEQATLQALEGALGGVPRKGKWTPPAPPRLRSGPRIVVVDRPGTKIATVLEVSAGPAYGAPDEIATNLALRALADVGLGRVTHELRDKLGEVPWIALEQSTFQASGWCGWRTATSPEHIAEVLTAADRVVHDLATHPLGEEEAAGLRARGTLSFASVYETSESTANAFAWPLAYGLPEDSLPKRQERFASASAADIQAAATRYFDPSHLRVAVVGDWAALRAPLESLGWGPIELRDVNGAIVKDKAHAHP